MHRRLPKNVKARWAAMALLALTPSPSQADPLILIGVMGNDFQTVDIAENRRTGDIVRTWLVTRNWQMQNIRGHMIRTLKNQVEVNCSRREIRALFSFGQDDSDAFIFQERLPGIWTPIPPGSAFVDLLRIVCIGPTATDPTFDDMAHLIRTQRDVAEHPIRGPN